MADSSSNYYPPVSFFFKLTLKGEKVEAGIAFQEVSGLSMERNIEEVGSGWKK